MNLSSVLKICLAVLVVVSAVPAQSVGPDVIVGDLPNVSNYSDANVPSMRAYALGTTSCNIGNQNLLWQANNSNHPVIAQNLYRIKDGRFEQIGQSWLKHGFTALTQSLCNTCNGVGGSQLGVGCSDPYSSGLNGQQTNLGPKYQVNAFTGAFPYPYAGPTITNQLSARGQVRVADVDPAQNVGAIYIGEGHYVAPDDAAAGNQDNNVSYRRMLVNASSLNLSFTAQTQREKPAIQAWQDLDPTVVLIPVRVPNEGLFILGFKEISLGGGNKRYEYALYNMNSHRSAYSLRITLPAGATASNFGFNDVDYHSGEAWNGIDWNMGQTGDEVIFSCTETYQQNQNANAIRWSTCYSFWFETTATPTLATIGLFRPGFPTEVTAEPPFSMTFATSGGGVGDLTIGLANIPTGTTEGFTIFSFDTGAPVGSGVLFGLDPDVLSLASITSPLGFGNILHWAWPVTGVYPDTNISLPAGYASSLIGMSADGVAAAFALGYEFKGTTGVNRITF